MTTYENERKIEIVGPFKAIQVRDCEVTLEDGVPVSKGPYMRFVVMPTDSTEDAEIQALKDEHHTAEILSSYSDRLDLL